MSANIQVEFYGVARLRSGVEKTCLEISGDSISLGEAIHRLAEKHQDLVPDCIQNERLLPSFKANVNGDRFIHELDELLIPGDSLLIMSADAGG